MYSVGSWVLLGAAFVWLGVLSFLIWQQKRFLESLFPKSGERDIRKKFEEVLSDIAGFKKTISETKTEVAKLEQQGLKHVQKVKLLRYNPYNDTGGDQSFSVAFLDQVGNGVVITSLHTRAGTRVFSKPVREGKSAKFQFSEEENEVIKQALGK